MQDYKNQKDKSLLIKLVKEKLDWYIETASDEEYDAAEVEELQRMLDELEPLDADKYPNVDEAWDRFWTNVETGVYAEMEHKGDAAETEIVGAASADNAEKEGNVRCEKNSAEDSAHKLIRFVLRHKTIVAAVIVVLVLAVGMGVQTEAVKNSGFFMWLKNDESGMQMVTSPDGLDGMTELKIENTYYNKDEVPNWAKEWVNIETRVMENYEYVWNNIEINEYTGRNIINSLYLFEESELIIGVMYYTETIGINTGVFRDYNLIGYVEENNAVKVYEKVEKKGNMRYMAEFYDGCMRCYVMGNEIENVEGTVMRYYGEINVDE